MPSPEISGRPLRASEFLISPHTEALPWPKPVTAEELMALSSEEEFVIRMWPLTLSEFLTGSPDKWKKVIDRELRTPSIDRLLARMAARLILAYRETKDRDALSRVVREAWNELQAAQVTAYATKQRDTHEQTQEAALRGVLVRQKDSEKWRDFARMVLDRGGNETLLQMATRIQEELLEAGWVPKAEWKNLSKTERRDTDTGYVPSVDVIVRFLRNPTKTQRQ